MYIKEKKSNKKKEKGLNAKNRIRMGVGVSLWENAMVEPPYPSDLVENWLFFG